MDEVDSYRTNRSDANGLVRFENDEQSARAANQFESSQMTDGICRAKDNSLKYGIRAATPKTNNAADQAKRPMENPPNADGLHKPGPINVCKTGRLTHHP